MEKTYPTVILVGGAPGSGKTTLATALGTQLEISSFSMDDLVIAALAVTQPETHPDLYALDLEPDYFMTHSTDQLIVDANKQHDATRPIFERIVGVHLRRGSAMVMDGWFFRPSWVAQLQWNNLGAVWIVTDDDVLETRERKNVDWLNRFSDPERVLQNFLGRSRWYNNLVREEATRHQMPILHQNGTVSVEDLCAMALEKLGS